MMRRYRLFARFVASAYVVACSQPPGDHVAATPGSDNLASATSIDACNGAPLHCFVRVQVAQLDAAPLVTPPGYGPSDLQSAYDLDVSASVDATVAVVEAYGYANLESDLAGYRAQFGLPACTVASGCLTIVNQTGQPSPLPGDAPAGDDWTVETALDIDMASAACPSCKI